MELIEAMPVFDHLPSAAYGMVPGKAVSQLRAGILR
jgi:hypothetical protein